MLSILFLLTAQLSQSAVTAKSLSMSRVFRMYILIVISGLLAFVSSKPFDTEGSSRELLLSLNEELLYSLETQEGIPNPSVHLALRLSDHHNLVKESEHLNKLKTRLHNDIQNSLSNSQSAVGLLALYSLALKASCYDLNTITFTVNNRKDSLLIHLKKQMEQEKDHIAFSHRPLTNYYQYSLGVLALCVSGIRVNHHVSNKLMKAVQQGHINHGGFESIDTLAMAGMALQCVKDAGSHVQNTADLDTALSTVKQKLLASQRADGHMGNKFSTGLAVQALLAMGSQVEECVASMEAMRADARRNTYHNNVMAISQTLPALQHRSYLDVKSMECSNDDDSLVVEPRQSVVVALPSQSTVAVNVVVVKISGSPTIYSVNVPKSSTLLETLELLQSNTGFMFVFERSLWGDFLSVVNGEQARISDRRYWHIASDDTALTQGISNYKIERAQKITIKNTTY